nr:hypothetical protein [Pseudomonadota bacterium]
MRGKKTITLFRFARPFVLGLLALTFLWVGAMVTPARANDLPLAAGSPLAGFSFDDRPLLLPVQRNFQMAMLTASSQIGRSCGRMESYGWRLGQSEQQRVNLIFSNTVDRLRALGYAVEAQAPSSISHDITLFTADRPTKHFLFMWSAGEIGLVMVLCESSPPLTGRMAAAYGAAATQLPPPQDVLQSKLETPAPTVIGHGRNSKLPPDAPFSPVGDWVGDFTCLRGYTGGTLHINPFKGEDFEGVFRFYPTPKNAYASKGSYAVYGQYDKESKRILINPGKWIEHPNGYYKTIIIGSFDPSRRSFSGFFQGIMGCTSFEARYEGKSIEIAGKALGHKSTKARKAKRRSGRAKPAATKIMPMGSPIDDTSQVFAPEEPVPTGEVKLPGKSQAVPLAPSSQPSPVQPAPAPISAPLVAPSQTPPVGASPAPATPGSDVIVPAPAKSEIAPIPYAPNQN